ncbi:Phosphatidylserine/phosphatidylglycerophosphate/cardiolipin synthase [Frankineae bacterium MT45]|nr:Phosphatidylserine/phosphatidylglycerophosphate/cardiolipin synthase [Frankineae bacterium MT45]
MTEWLLTAAERGNADTGLDRRHPDSVAWTGGNEVTPLVHGGSYFPELLRCVGQMVAGDLLLFTDWRGDPDQLLDGAGTEVSTVFAAAAARGVLVRGLVWRSHLDRFAFSEQQNRHLGEEIEAAGGECLLDMRVRPGGSHHQKFVVLRHPSRPELDVAFVGGIDLCHSRNDDHRHAGDDQSQPMAAVYGATPPWHDIQVALRGPAVGDVESVFRERWSDPAPLSRNPVNVLSERLRGDDHRAQPLPPQTPDPEPHGSARVQLLRTYPRRRPGYPFARDGERSVARGYQKVIARARSLIYVEDQYLWSSGIVRCFATALRRNPELRMIAVVPHYPDQDGRISLPPNLIGRRQALRELHAAGGDRVAVYGIENHAGTPVYVHAKVCVVDDVWACVGSDNINRRSWTHDSELSCAVVDEALDEREPRVIDGYGDGARRFARELRLRLAREHLDRSDDEDGDLIDPVQAFDAFARSASELQRWVTAPAELPRPSGRLRPYRMPQLSRRTRAWATPLYHLIYDPDGRPLELRRNDSF